MNDKSFMVDARKTLTGEGMDTVVHDTRPWGHYEILLDDPVTKVKKIVVTPGKRLSLQRHWRRSEHWYVVAGSGTVTLGDSDHLLGTGEAIDIPVGSAHRIQNAGSTELVFIEVQTGDYFGEDDIERLADDFGRAGAQ